MLARPLPAMPAFLKRTDFQLKSVKILLLLGFALEFLTWLLILSAVSSRSTHHRGRLRPTRHPTSGTVL